MLNFTYFQPTRITFGSSKISELGSLAAEKGKKALLVMDKFLDEQGLGEAAKISLDKAGVEWHLFTDVLPNPTAQSVDKAAASLNDADIGVVIGLGGGSAVDYAKAMAVALTHERDIWDFVNEPGRPVKDITGATLPIISIPTTAGTGADLTPLAVLVNTETLVKRALYSENIFPTHALIDPALTLTVPPKLTFSTGLDALSHAIEALISVEAHSFTAMLATEAITRISTNLPAAVADGSNPAAREQMSFGAALAGLAIAAGDVTLPHALAHPLGGRFDMPHGEAIAIVLPEIIKTSWMCAQDKFAAVARAMGAAEAGESDHQAARKCGKGLAHLYTDCGFTATLADYGVKEGDLPAIAEDATGYMAGCLSMHPRKMDRADILKLLEKLV